MKIISDPKIVAEYVGDNPIRVLDADGENGLSWMTTTNSPTGNCQVQSIAYMGLLLNASDYSEYSDNKVQVIPTIKKLLGDSYKQILMFDVKSQYEAQMDKLCENSLILKAPYKSTNESDMIIYLAKTTKFINA